MIEYKCQDCGCQIGFLAADELERRIESGDVVKGDRIVPSTDWDGKPTTKRESGYWGVCRPCQQAAARRPVRGDSTAQADAQMNRIRDNVASLRRRADALSVEEVVHAVVEQEFNPHAESDPDFRAYLLGEGAPKDPSVEEVARRFMENLPENSLVAPADNPVGWGNE